MEKQIDNYSFNNNNEKYIVPINIDNDYLILKREYIESQFLYQKFQIVINESIELIFNLYNNKNSNNNITTPILINDDNGTLSLSHKILESFSKFNHTCNNHHTQEECQCIWIIELLIQSLYELGKPSDALKLVNRFYQDGISNTPINILTLSIHLLIHLKSYNESKVIIIEALKRNGNQFQQDQYEQLIELLVFHVMFRMNEINESILLLENDTNISDWKRQGFTKALLEMVQIKEMEEKTQRELQLKKEQLQQQLQQQQIEKQRQSSLSSPSSSSSPSLSHPSPQLNNHNNHNLPPTSIIKQIKDIFNEAAFEILAIRDLNSLQIAINRIVFGNFRKLIYYIFKRIKLMYLKSKLFYLKNNTTIRQLVPTIIALTIFIIGIKRMLNGNSTSGGNNNQNNSKINYRNDLINTKKLQQPIPQQSQQIQQNLNNRRSFGIKNVQQPQSNTPYRNSQQYQQYRTNNASIHNNNNSTSNWSGFKQLLSNTFSFNRA